jgi:hypothetical protein
MARSVRQESDPAKEAPVAATDMAQSRMLRWLASVVALGAVSVVAWLLVRGCDSPPGAAERQADVAAHAARINALSDESVREIALQVAWHVVERGRVPESLDALAGSPRPAGWPALPHADKRGSPIAYRTTGVRTYALVLVGKDGQGGTPDDLALPMAMPPDLPVEMTDEAFRVWWQLHELIRLTQEVESGLKGLDQ